MSIQVTECRPWPGKPRRFSVQKITNCLDLKVGQIMTLTELKKLRSNGVIVVIK